MSELNESEEKKKTTTEKIWDSTKKTLHIATFQANKYKRVVQKKVDLATIHRKIGVAHSDLGKEIDELRENGIVAIMETEAVTRLLAKLDELKDRAAKLEAEIEAIKQEEAPEEEEEQSNAE
jgi:DNA-binding transcriptional regulator LsrR (DeoR family)